MPSSTLTSKGQTVIPKAIRDHLGLHPGDELDFLVHNGGEVVIRPAALDIRQLRGALHRPGQKPVSLAKMNRAVRMRAATWCTASSVNGSGSRSYKWPSALQ